MTTPNVIYHGQTINDRPPVYDTTAPSQEWSHQEQQQQLTQLVDSIGSVALPKAVEIV